MKITYSVGASVPGGGIGNLAAKALDALQKQDYLHQAFVTFNKTDFLIASKVTSLGLVERIPNYVLKDNFFDLLVSTQITDTDIFHGWNNMALYSLRKAKRKGARIVIERASSHIRTQKRLLEEQMRKFGLSQTPVNPLTIKKSLREYEEADVVLVPSQFAFDSFLENGFPKSKLRLLNFGVEAEKYGLPEEKKEDLFRALFVGQVGIRKGLPYLLQAWQELDLKKSELLVVGPIYPDFKAMVQKYKLDKVKFVHYSQNLKEFYQKSEVFVFPSIEEGSALVTFEAMASGLPVITTPNSGSLVENGKEGLLVKAGQVDELKEAIRTLYNDRHLSKKLGASGRAKVKLFSWEKYQENLINIYKELN